MNKPRFAAVLAFIFLLIAPLAYSNNATLEAKLLSEAYFMAGKHYFSHDNFETAAVFFKKSIALKPDFAEAYHNLGISYYYGGNDGKAIKFLKKAVELNEGYSKAHYSIALIYYEKKDFDNAIMHFLRAAEIEPNDANAHFDLAVAYADAFRKKESEGNVSSGDLEYLKEAINHYLMAEELKPGFEHALSNAEIIKGVIESYN